MKRRIEKTITIFFLSFALLIPTSSFCQNYISPLLGLNSSKNTGAENKTGETNYGLNLGVEFFGEVTEKFGLGLNIQYSEKGYYQGANSDNYILTKHFYAVTSIFTQTKLMEFKKLKNLKSYLKLGPYLGFWQSGNSLTKIESVKTKSSIDFDRDYSKADLGISFGLPFELKCFFIEPKIEYGFTDLNISDKRKSNNISYQLILGYRFTE